MAPRSTPQTTRQQEPMGMAPTQIPRTRTTINPPSRGQPTHIMPQMQRKRRIRVKARSMGLHLAETTLQNPCPAGRVDQTKRLQMSWPNTPARIVTTRRQHKCQYCTNQINPGEKAVTIVYADLGRIWRDYIHTYCSALYNEYVAIVYLNDDEDIDIITNFDEDFKTALTYFFKGLQRIWSRDG